MRGAGASRISGFYHKWGDKRAPKHPYTTYSDDNKNFILEFAKLCFARVPSLTQFLQDESAETTITSALIGSNSFLILTLSVRNVNEMLINSPKFCLLKESNTPCTKNLNSHLSETDFSVKFRIFETFKKFFFFLLHEKKQD